MYLKTFVYTLIFSFPVISAAKTVRYDLVVRQANVNMSQQKSVDFALTVNGGIPAPTLEFTEGDDAEILVKNELIKDEVSIHWHGLLLPPEEDGVAYVNTPPIHAGQSRVFRFKLRQSGTYWYHSHTATQEQKGVYGAFIIQPKQKTLAYDRDVAVVLSDWADEDAEQILSNLRKDGDYYLFKKKTMRSIYGALKSDALGTYFQNEWTRMGGMDYSDVGYDAFLINGKRDSQLVEAHPGEKIRLRIINAAASSYFHVSLGQAPMTVVSADGVDMKPVQAKEILIGMAETYDVIFSPPEHKNYELRATVQDVTGYASAWIGMGEKVSAPDKPKPNLYASMDHSAHGGGHAGHMSHMNHAAPASDADHGAHIEHGEHAVHKKAGESPTHQTMHMGHTEGTEHAGMDHGAHGAHGSHGQTAQHQEPIATPLSLVESLTVDDLRAKAPISYPRTAKTHNLDLVLGGDMTRYIWHINGKAIYQDKLLEIGRGEVVRITFNNTTMMHHPMHLHGHFFRVLNEGGELSPLKHTVDVPPHGKRTIEFYANEPGQWMLHCHNLYHMHTGMARVVKYRDFTPSAKLSAHEQHDPHMHDHLYTRTRLEAASNHAQGEFTLMKTWDEFGVRLEHRDTDGRNFRYDKKWETEGDLVYRRWFSNYLNLTAGGTHYDEKTYGMVGVGYILPMLVNSQVLINHEGRVRLGLEKRLQWTKTIFSDADITWRPNWGGDHELEFEVSLMYQPAWRWGVGLMVTERNIGLGAQVQF